MIRLLPLEIVLADARLDVENQRFDRCRFEDLVERAAVMAEEGDRLRAEMVVGLTDPDRELLLWLAGTLAEITATTRRLSALQ